MGKRVETFQLVQLRADFIQAGTGESVHGGDLALIFLSRPSAYRASVSLN